MLTLKAILPRLGRKQSELGLAVGLSETSIAQLVNHDKWPRRKDVVAEKIRQQLRDWGAEEETITQAFDWAGEGPPPLPRPQPQKLQKEEEPMFFPHQRLHPEARRHFGLTRDPFHNDLNGPEDIFMSPEIRYVREEMFQTAMHGGFLAVLGESGSGKSTLRLELLDRIQRERFPVQVIEPSVLGMEDSNQSGKAVKADGIADAIVFSLAPRTNPKRGMEAKTRQIHDLLAKSAESGTSHVLIIEEAHGLPMITLKHLKRFSELRRGFSRLLGIILIGHPELSHKLSPKEASVREVVQRIDLVELPSLEKQLQKYLEFKLGRSSKKLEEVFDASAIPALQERLLDPRAKRSRAYPLAVNNVVVAAMNLAAGIGAPKVTADVVREIR